jgi:hypothetical protein
MDAYERLMKLNLNEKQEREIVRVIVHCVGQVCIDDFCMYPAERTFTKLSIS